MPVIECRHGALLSGGECRFRVWAPEVEKIELVLRRPEERVVPMEEAGDGYWECRMQGVHAGSRYLYRLNGSMDRLDPASRHQPDGVHGASAVAAVEFNWTDSVWPGIELEQCIFYELHVGTFTESGTFDAIVPHLSHLSELGITVLHLMPVAAFPGSRNWGYDGVYPFAVQESYGGPEGLKRLVDACHAAGLAISLDVVYNHLGPEGNYLRDFGPYFTGRHKTPWGDAFNFDGPGSDEVRRYFLENALRWVGEFHIDALRLDAVHAIHDESAIPFLEELGEQIHCLGSRLGRAVHVVAESDRNDPRLVERRALGGIGLDALWNDDFHHSLRTILTGERSGYYVDFGEVRQLAKAYSEGFVRDGSYSQFRGRRHGRSSQGMEAERFIVFFQNHDQVGNRVIGDRLTGLIGFEELKVSAAAYLLSPNLPLVFMGEEYAETAPFLYFVSHGDAELVQAVREGRKREFAEFFLEGDPPDAQAEETFQRSKLNWQLKESGRHAALFRLYAAMIQMRKAVPAMSTLRKEQMDVWSGERERLMVVRRWTSRDEALLILSFGSEDEVVAPAPEGRWGRILDTAEERWLGPGGVFASEIHGGECLRLPARTAAAALYRRKREPRRKKVLEDVIALESAE